VLDLRKLVKDYHDTARSYVEIVPWMSQISPSLILNKDGSLLVCYAYEGVDSEGQERHEVDRLTTMLERALRVFDERFTVWFTVDRRRTSDYPSAKFEDVFSQYVDDRWREQFVNGNQFSNRYYFSILYTPPGGINGFFEKIAHYTKVEGVPFLKAIIDSIKSSVFKRAAFKYEARQLESFSLDFNDKLSAFDDNVGEIAMRRLEGEELLGFLHDRCSPASYGQMVRRPVISAHLDAYLPSDTLVTKDDCLQFQGDQSIWVAGMSVKDWPDWTEPGLLDGILAVPGELTFSQVMRISEHDTAKKLIVDKERHNRNMEKSFVSYMIESFTKEESRQRDSGRVMMAEDAHDAATEMTTVNRVYGHYNMTILSYGESRAECEAVNKSVSQLLRRNAFVAVREGMHLLSAFLGTMPGQAGALVRWHFVSTANVSDLAPIRTLSVGQKENVYFSEQYSTTAPALTVLSTEYAIPYYFNFHQADLAHTLVIGPSRTGKSSFNNFLISQFQKYSPCHTYIFDKDYSCRIPTILQNGIHVDMSAEHSNRVSINPMILLKDPNNWTWLAQWLEILLTSRGYEMTAEDAKNLWEGIEQLASQPEDQWRLVNLYPLVSKAIAAQLDQWVGTGQRNRYFDNAEDTFDLGSFSCIEMGGLFHDEIVARAFLEYAFFRISKKLDGRPTLIYVEEAWFMLAEEQFRKRINDWLRTLAKKNAFLIMATQSLDEIARSDIFATIIDNIPNRIYLPNANAFAHREMYKNQFSLNDAQIERIRNGTPKLHYYIVTPLLSRMAEVHLPPEVLAVVRSDSRAQKVFNQHLSSNDPEWKVNYVEEMVHG